MSAIEDARAALVDLRASLTDYPEEKWAHEALDKIDALITEHEHVTAPPTDDEREALARIIGGAVYGDPNNFSRATEAADEILAADFRRQGPPIDAPRIVRDAIHAEQRRIASLPDSHKTWTGDEGRAWQNGMSNAARIAAIALEAARDAS